MELIQNTGTQMDWNTDGVNTGHWNTDGVNA